MSGEYGELRSVTRIPDAGGLVSRGGDDAGAVRRVGGGKDTVVMAREHRELHSRARIPDADALVERGRHDASTVRRVGDCMDRIAMAGEHRELSVGGANVLKHTDGGRCVSLSEFSIPEHFE